MLWVEEKGGLVLDARHAQPQEMIDRAHPVTVSLCQVVVHGDQVSPLATEGIEVNGEGGDQGLSLAGLHLGDLGLVEDDASHELDIKVALSQGSLCCLPDCGKGLGKKPIQHLPPLQPSLELICLVAELLVGEGLKLRLKGIDALNCRLEARQLLLIGIHKRAKPLKHDFASLLKHCSYGEPGMDAVDGLAQERCDRKDGNLSALLAIADGDGIGDHHLFDW
ncbi:hypothetical protein ES703_08101 [subsurface metagenome]